MTRTKLLLAGLLAGAVASGAGCKTDKGSTSTGSEPTTSSEQDAGTGGASYAPPESTFHGLNPSPEERERTRETEPEVHKGTHEEPGTGGTGLEEEPIDKTERLGHESGDEPLNPGAPATQPPSEDELRHHDENPDEPNQNH